METRKSYRVKTPISFYTPEAETVKTNEIKRIDKQIEKNEIKLISMRATFNSLQSSGINKKNRVRRVYPDLADLTNVILKFYDAAKPCDYSQDRDVSLAANLLMGVHSYGGEETDAE
jgi:hypothetical protein